MFHLLIQQRLQAAVHVVVPDADLGLVQVRTAGDAKFGDYQCSALMSVAKVRRQNPRQLAADVLQHLDVSDICEPVEIAGPGYLNFRLKIAAVTGALRTAVAGEHLFFAKTAKPRTVVIDFSSPNVAKPMHIGHIRSTVLGACLVRILRLLGHRVESDNHIGDWGTQFGMLLIGWKSMLNREALAADAIGELERLYKAVSAACTVDPALRESARAELVKLQDGDAVNVGIWEEMIRLSKAHFASIYTRLGVSFDHTLGESFYNPWLKEVAATLLAKGIARESEGAIGVFSDTVFANSPAKPAPKDDPFLIQRDGEWLPNPVLIQKSDGAANYATTDLATLDYRLRTWSPDDIIYVTDGRQQLHFRQVFATFAAWQPEALQRVKLTHAWFGAILGDDGKPYKTRSGETVKLADVLNEAEERALKVVAEKRPDLPPAELAEIARIVGLGAVKYQDLLPNRQSDYVFSWDKMLALQGNTAPYIQYQFTRAAKVVRDSGTPREVWSAAEVQLADPTELALARHLLNFGITLEAVAEECRPNYLCNYLYELAGMYSKFYENCPVLKAAEPVRNSRLILCDIVSQILKLGLECLGIEVTETM